MPGAEPPSPLPSRGAHKPSHGTALASRGAAWGDRAFGGLLRVFGATVLVEPVSGPKPYPLRTAADALAVVDRVRAAGAANVGFLCDVYHLATNGDDIDAVLRDHAADIAHVQIADVPGRGEPGTGTLDIVGWLHALRDRGYRGRVSLEYKPTVPSTPESLRWLPPQRRGAGAIVRRRLGLEPTSAVELHHEYIEAIRRVAGVVEPPSVG